VVERVNKAKLPSKVVIASPHQIPVKHEQFIGDENNVLKRFYDCATKYGADIIVRVTADCPFLDPRWIDFCVYLLIYGGYEYVSNRPDYSDGLDVEVFTYKILQEAQNKAKQDFQKEHVTPWIRENSKKVALVSSLRKYKTKVSVDTTEDLERVRKIYGLGKQDSPNYWG
jgi:spore coat polysaccharide biosynthesis protein SpsF